MKLSTKLDKQTDRSVCLVYGWSKQKQIEKKGDIRGNMWKRLNICD